jgi:hypothetical protein
LEPRADGAAFQREFGGLQESITLEPNVTASKLHRFGTDEEV